MYERNAVILGAIGEGKSLLLLDFFDRLGGGRLLWDPVGDLPCPTWAIEADQGSDPAALRRALGNGWPVLFRAGEGTRLGLDQQVSYLVRLCKRTHASLLLDEAHLVMKQGRPNEDVLTLMRLARHDDCSVLLASQDPQTMDKDAMRVGGPHIYVFNVPLSDAWFKEYGIPPEAMAQVRAAGPHHFCEITPAKEIKPPRKLDLPTVQRLAA